MRLHEWKIGSFLPLRLGVEHPGEAELGVQPTEEAVEGRSVWFVRTCRVSRGGRVDRDGGMTGGGLAGNPGRVGVGVGPRPGLQTVGERPGGMVRDDLDSDGLADIRSDIL